MAKWTEERERLKSQVYKLERENIIQRKIISMFSPQEMVCRVMDAHDLDQQTKDKVMKAMGEK